MKTSTVSHRLKCSITAAMRDANIDPAVHRVPVEIWLLVFECLMRPNRDVHIFDQTYQDRRAAVRELQSFQHVCRLWKVSSSHHIPPNDLLTCRSICSDHLCAAILRFKSSHQGHSDQMTTPSSADVATSYEYPSTYTFQKSRQACGYIHFPFIPHLTGELITTNPCCPFVACHRTSTDSRTSHATLPSRQPASMPCLPAPSTPCRSSTWTLTTISPNHSLISTA